MMFLRILFILFVVTFMSCGAGEYSCRSKCGLMVHAPVRAGFCEQLDEFETRTNNAFFAFGITPGGDVRFQNACASEKGWVVYQVPLDSFDSFGRDVYGDTNCQTGVVRVANKLPLDGAFAHELAHVTQKCEPLHPYDVEDYYHSNWEGIYSALKDAGLPP